jgi:hypothetical protein
VLRLGLGQQPSARTHVRVGGGAQASFIPARTRGFDDLIRDAARVDIAGMTLLVASLADVIRSKEAAGRDKDRAALPLLRKLLSETTQPPS